MKLFHVSQNEKALEEEQESEGRQIDLAADIMQIHRFGGNIDIRDLHPEMTEQETIDYLSNLIDNHMRRY
ncbi:hypothetical protein KDA_65390 [Dictyobacter alpinus]|uniref:Uncharacterized protein n=1 Tax=Dictyobacter alpinus TaxID=2014873 RepID=A0A402BI68_9CHLR|nr:hypothetical protein [Dictyobacter alpinus]GCE31055.1 hypothetical protein KDA_65390 [Dictyobacter alpinus]